MRRIFIIIKHCKSRYLYNTNIIIMDIAVTKLKLLDLVMHLNDEAKVAKLIDIIVGMENNDVVAYTALGEPLNIDQYKAHVKEGLKDIEEGRVTSHDDLLEEIKSW